MVTIFSDIPPVQSGFGHSVKILQGVAVGSKNRHDML